jgi:RNA polymerase sigma-70 factor (ECF subfamily)
MSHWLQSVTEPEDIVQSIFRSMFRGVQGKSYDAPPGDTLWNLLAVIAVRKTRRRATHHRAERRDARRTVPLDSVDENAALDPSQYQHLELDLRDVVNSLRESDRAILLARIQGHTVEEIGCKIGRTSRTVERSLQRIRRQLADHLLDEPEA